MLLLLRDRHWKCIHDLVVDYISYVKCIQRISLTNDRFKVIRCKVEVQKVVESVICLDRGYISTKLKISKVLSL